MIQENFIKIYENSFKNNWELPALTDYSKGTTFSFADVAEEIARIHILFEECQIRRGDKIALIGKDSARWCIVYMAAVTYGAIIVPILQDFSPNDVHHIINHSESVFLFVTGRCNAKCAMCFYAGEMDKKEKDLTFDEIRKVSETAGEFNRLWISGGEPTLREDLPEIIEMFYRSERFA